MQMPRSIQRSREDRVVAGVCGGVARAAGLDPTAVRVAAVVLAALGGLGLVAYVAAALVLPEEGGGEPLVRMAGGPRERAAAVAGAAVLVLAGIAAAAGDPWPWDRPGLVAAIAVLGGIAWLALRAPAPARAASASAPAPPSGAPPGAVRVRPTWADADPGAPAAPAPSRRRGGPALVVPAILAALAVAAVLALALGPLRDGVGERLHRPATLDGLRDEYRLGVGDLRVDLTGVPLPPGTTRTRVDLGVGRAVVTVPADVAVRVDGSATAGEVVAFGRAASGVGVDTRADAPGAGGRTLVLDVHVGAGRVQVERAPSRAAG